mgnify:CR=1 FL=1
MNKIPFVNLSKQFKTEKKHIIPILEKELASGNYINGSIIESLETKIEKYLKIKHCVCLNSGTDALVMALFALGIKKDDEVITVSNSFIASVSSIVHIGAKPIFVDIDESLNIDTSKIESKITSKTKAIMPVHLSGKICKMDKIISIARKYNIKVIEDSAQSFGSKYKNRFSGTIGDIGCFSAHPLKNFNAMGDAGFIVTKYSNLARQIKMLRNHGLETRNNSKFFGYVSRMDNIQASILNYRIKNLDKIILKRRKIATTYFKLLKSVKQIDLPYEDNDNYNTYHTFVIRCKNRESLIKYLNKKGIETKIHYPIPIHKQTASIVFGFNNISLKNTEKFSKQILSLPINQYLKISDIKYICKEIINYYSQ